MNTIKYFLILFFGTVIGYGQSMPNVVPPSPEAASLLKFSEVPVSLYTGVPNVNIPLFEIESGGVTVPISISYHARGIKVAEIASRVGLGWTLNCGGVVSRQIRDDADEVPLRADFNGFFNDPEKRQDEFEDFAVYMDAMDFIPDQYMFNVNGLSGKFIYDYTDNTVLSQNYSDIKIIPGGYFYTIIDGQGNKYDFGEYGDTGDRDQNMESLTLSERGTNYGISNTSGDPVYQNTWHLAKITSQKGQTITFNYIDEVSYFYRRSYDKYEQGIPLSQSEYKSYVSHVKSTQKLLNRIDFDKGWVGFVYEDRQDITGGKRLKAITLYNTSHQVVRHVDFTYQDVLSADDNNTHPNLKSLDPPARTRTYLASVQFKYGSQNSLPPYTFEYDETPLPNRHSNSQDIWGYYNARANGRCLKNASEYTTPGARSVDTIASKAGMLRKIIYPEGGHTSFSYEQNKVYNPFPKDVVFDNPNPYTSQVAHIGVLNFNPTWNPAVQNVYTKTFTISAGLSGTPNYMVDIGDHEGCQWPYNTSSCKFNIVLRRTDNTASYLLLYTGPNQRRNIPALDPGEYTLEVWPLYNYHDPRNDSQLIPVDPNNPNGPLYDPGNPNNHYDYFSVDINWLETPTDGFMLAGGKRIKKIEYRDPLNNQGMTKTYSYTDPATGKSSGVLFGLPNFRSIMQTVTTIGGQQWSLFGWIGNVPGSPLSTFQEQSLGYGTVTEYNGEGTNTLGKTVHAFTMFPDTGDYYKFPYHPPTDNEWLRGKEISATHYKKNNGGSFSPVKKIENEYLYGDGDAMLLNPLPYRKKIEHGLEDCPAPGSSGVPLYCTNSGYVKNKKMFRLPLALFYDGSYGQVHTDTTSHPQMYKAYQLTGGTMDLKKTTVTDYFDNGSQMVNTTDYSYRYDYHYNVSQVSQQTSDAAPSVTKYFYVNDPEMTGKPAKADLIKKNMKQVPLVTETFKGGARLSQTETVFKDWNPNDTLVRLMLPQYVKTAKGSLAPTETRIEYTKIDSDNGNILEVKQTNGIPIAYIWGYNGTYPLAKIENATFAQVVTALGTTEAALKALTVVPANIRTLMPNAMITTYTYNPLVGVTSVTDPKGDVLNYEYDVFGRLQYVKDKWGNTLSENQYIYGQ